MATTDIARVVARAVLGDVIAGSSSVDDPEALDMVVTGLLTSAMSVTRRRMRNVGEVVELTFVVPPDPTTPED